MKSNKECAISKKPFPVIISRISSPFFIKGNPVFNSEISPLVFSYCLKVVVKKEEKKSREFNALPFEKLGLEYIHNSDLKHL